jgi:hypothetical protein
VQARPCPDVIVTFGSTCVPLTTQRATGKIVDANFISASEVPPPPLVNDASGVPLACATLDASTTSGLVAVGATNFFYGDGILSWYLGDESDSLKLTCQ